jgi:uncharacterized protein
MKTTLNQARRATLELRCSRPHLRTLHVRIPAWTTESAEVSVNGRPLEAISAPGSYLAIHRVWRDGDRIGVRLPMPLRHEALPGDETVTAILHGPLVLAANLGPGPADGPDKVIHGRPTE